MCAGFLKRLLVLQEGRHENGRVAAVDDRVPFQQEKTPPLVDPNGSVSSFQDSNLPMVCYQMPLNLFRPTHCRIGLIVV